MRCGSAEVRRAVTTRTEFVVGDRVWMRGGRVPLTVTVLELSTCGGEDGCGGETFRFLDPVTEDEDWAHTAEFEVHPLSRFLREDR